jgi:hypothetical protein
MMVRRLITIAGVAAVVFFVATDPGRATEVFGQLRDSLASVGSGLGDFLDTLT